MSTHVTPNRRSSAPAKGSSPRTSDVGGSWLGPGAVGRWAVGGCAVLRAAVSGTELGSVALHRSARVKGGVGHLLAGLGLAIAASGCSDTSYTFFEGGSGGTGGAVCTTPECVPVEPGTGGQTASGGETSSSGGVTGVGGGGGEAAAGPCENPDDPSSPPVRLELVQSGLCFARGPAFTLVNDPAYLISLVPCDSNELALWLLRPVDPDAHMIENKSSGFNLDVQFASPDDGTPFVLFEPHQLYNQRFQQITAEGGFALSPLHAPGKCLTERDGVLALLACDPATANQTIRILECLPPE